LKEKKKGGGGASFQPGKTPPRPVKKKGEKKETFSNPYKPRAADLAVRAKTGKKGKKIFAPP